MSAIAWRIAARELRAEARSGLKGFRIFLACLALGVAAIGAVASVRQAITDGLTREGAVILGGDAEMEFTYRLANEDERAFMDAIALQVSQTIELRSMAAFDGPEGTEFGLTELRAVDGAYPIYGSVGLEPAQSITDALALVDGRHGAVMQPVLIDRLGMEIGDRFRIGSAEFELRAALVGEPDGAAGGFGLGPRSLISLSGLEASGLIQPGTLYESEYRLQLPEGADFDALRAQMQATFPEGGIRWQDSRRAAPGVERFVDRIGSFLVLVGLAGLAVGGVGIAAAVRAYLEGKIATIATLKTLGAEGRVIFAAYFLQIGLLTVIGVALGLMMGAALPFIALPLMAAYLPVPLAPTLYPAALAEAASYGALTAVIFTLLPLARAEGLRAATLFRQAAPLGGAWPAPRYLVALIGLTLALVGLAVALSGVAYLALATALGIIAALGVLALAAWGIRAAARAMARNARIAQGRPRLRLALAAIGAPRSEAMAVTLSLGLGLSVLAAVGQIDHNLRQAINRDLPELAPSYFFVDIQPDQLQGFLDRTTSDPAVSRVDTAPMLRGVVSAINGVLVRDLPEHWVLRGDRGLTYRDTAPPASEIVAGAWWGEGYDGPPVMAFAAEEAAEIGLTLGDEVTVNVLGRDITAEIVALREVDFSNAGIGFVMTLSSNAIAGAPHTHIATVYAEEAAEAQILRDVARAAPNVTAIRIRDALDRVAEALSGIAAATSLGAGVTLLTGFIVLIGAAASGEKARRYEAAILKTLGATRGGILASFALRSAILGAAAGLIALMAGALGGFAVMHFVMEADYAFALWPALGVVGGGAMASLLAGLAYALRPISVRPARILRAQD